MFNAPTECVRHSIVPNRRKDIRKYWERWKARNLGSVVKKFDLDWNFEWKCIWFAIKLSFQYYLSICNTDVHVHIQVKSYQIGFYVNGCTHLLFRLLKHFLFALKNSFRIVPCVTAQKIAHLMSYSKNAMLMDSDGRWAGKLSIVTYAGLHHLLLSSRNKL